MQFESLISKNKKILIVAGEASGDLWGSLLVHALHSLDSELQFFGVGLERMQDAGVSLVFSPEKMVRLSVAGTLENLGKLSGLFRLRQKILEEVKQKKPVAAILIDYPAFNLHLAKKLNALKIPLFYYAPPQTWLWGRWRVKKLKKYFKKLFVFFPFEKELYRKSDLDVDWVGHPVLNWIETLQRQPPKEGFRFDESDVEVIGLLPGSRLATIVRNLPAMLEAACLLYRANPQRRFLIPLAPMVPREFLDKYLGNDYPFVHLLQEETCQVLFFCRCAMVVAGTAALETALCEVPMVLCGKFSLSTYWIARYFLRICPEGIVNRLAGKKIIPELWQQEVTGKRLAEEVEALLNDRLRYEHTERDFKKIRETFAQKGNASLNAARGIISILDDVK